MYISFVFSNAIEKEKERLRKEILGNVVEEYETDVKYFVYYLLINTINKLLFFCFYYKKLECFIKNTTLFQSKKVKWNRVTIILLKILGT